MKLNLACGKNKIAGWFNVDISEQVKPDEVRNLLQFPWPWADVEEIFCSHFVEHIGDEFIPFMDECYRILKPGGILRVRAPYYTSIRCWQDPTHKRAISEATWRYFNKQERDIMGVGHYAIQSDFKVERMQFHFPEEMARMSDEERKDLLHHAWNTAADIEVLLRKNDPNQQGMDRQADSLVSN